MQLVMSFSRYPGTKVDTLLREWSDSIESEAFLTERHTSSRVNPRVDEAVAEKQKQSDLQIKVHQL